MPSHAFAVAIALRATRWEISPATRLRRPWNLWRSESDWSYTSIVTHRRGHQINLTADDNIWLYYIWYMVDRYHIPLHTYTSLNIYEHIWTYMNINEHIYIYIQLYTYVLKVRERMATHKKNKRWHPQWSMFTTSTLPQHSNCTFTLWHKSRFSGGHKPPSLGSLC